MASLPSTGPNALQGGPVGTDAAAGEALFEEDVPYTSPSDSLMRRTGLATMSPIMAVLRSLELKEASYWRSFDEWMCDLKEPMSSSLLKEYKFISAVNADQRQVQAAKRDTNSDIDVTDMGVPSNYFGFLGRDLEERLWTNKLELLDIDAVVRQKDAIHGISMRRYDDKTSDDAVDLSKDGENILYCYIHERVARKLKSEKYSNEYVYELIGKRIVEGALIREEHQYKKKVTRDVRELRLDRKERVLYARSARAILIMALVLDHKLDMPIAVAQKEIDIMRSWMKVRRLFVYLLDYIANRKMAKMTAWMTPL